MLGSISWLREAAQGVKKRTAVVASSPHARGSQTADLWMAAWTGSEAELRTLLARCAPEQAGLGPQWTPLMAACSAGHAGCARALLEHGSNLNAWTAGNVSVSMLAALAGQARCLELLARSGADLAALDREGLGVWHAAALSPGSDCLDALAKLARAGGPSMPPSAVGCAARSSTTKALEWMIAAKADLNAADPDGMSAAMHAAGRMEPHWLRLLADAGPT
jgi:hypothetical protein